MAPIKLIFTQVTIVYPIISQRDIYPLNTKQNVYHSYLFHVGIIKWDPGLHLGMEEEGGVMLAVVTHNSD